MHLLKKKKNNNNNTTDRRYIKYANHSFAESETGRRSRRDGNTQVEVACILVDFIGSSIQLFHRYYLHELADHARLIFLQSLPRCCLPYRRAHICILSVPALGPHALIKEEEEEEEEEE
jgi:hypothetical protein